MQPYNPLAEGDVQSIGTTTSDRPIWTVVTKDPKRRAAAERYLRVMGYECSMHETVIGDWISGWVFKP